MANVYRRSIILFALVMLSGCGPKALHLQIRFDQVMGLKAGDSLIFEGNSVGGVDEVRYTKDGDYLVDVTVKPNFLNAATRNSRFYIADDPSIEGKKAIEIIQENPGGDVLRDGEIVAGSTRPSVFQSLIDRLQKEAGRYQQQVDTYLQQFKQRLNQSAQELTGELKTALDDLAEQFSRLSEENKDAPDSQELKTLEERLARLAEEMSRSQQAIREKIKKEVLPEIQAYLYRLRERLERYHRQEEMAPLDRELNEMQKV